MDIYNLNAAVNIAAACLVLWASVKVQRCRLLPGWLAAMFHLAMVGWIAIYLIVLLAEPIGVESIIGLSSVRFASIFIRPLVTLTLGAIAATFIYRMRSCQE